MKPALVLSGGGSRGAFAVGAVEVLHEANIAFDIIASTSTGALIAPLLQSLRHELTLATQALKQIEPCLE
jgi:NTE family protein